MPSYLNKLSFATFTEDQRLQNFYMFPEFFIVSAAMKDFFEKNIGESSLQVKPVRVLNFDQSPAGSPYFAVKTIETTDCISAHQSTCSSIGSSEKFDATFAQSLVSIELEQALASEYATSADLRFESYPHLLQGVGNVVLTVEAISPRATIIQPKLWPGHLLIEQQFSEQLAAFCAGGTPGYYFWTLPLDMPAAAFRKKLIGMR